MPGNVFSNCLGLGKQVYNLRYVKASITQRPMSLLVFLLSCLELSSMGSGINIYIKRRK